MARYAWILKSWLNSIFDKHIAVADAASFNLHAHLAIAGLRSLTFNYFPTHQLHLFMLLS